MKTIEKDFKGTKGEFFQEENANHYPFVMGTDNNVVAVLFDPNDGSLFYGRSYEETKANARLFANSKNVLSILIEAVNDIEKEALEPNDFPWVEIAKKAINDSL